MRKQAVESAKLGSWIFYEGGWLSVLSTGTGKTWLLVETLVSVLCHHHQISSFGPGGWVLFCFFILWFKTRSMASKKNSSSNSIKITGVIACFWLMIFYGTQVTFLPGCTGKKTPSNTLSSILVSLGQPPSYQDHKPYPSGAWESSNQG